VIQANMDLTCPKLPGVSVSSPGAHQQCPVKLLEQTSVKSITRNDLLVSDSQRAIVIEDFKPITLTVSLRFSLLSHLNLKQQKLLRADERAFEPT